MNLNFAGNVGTGGTPLASVDPLLTDRQLAEMMSCGRSTVWRWATEGIIPQPLKIGGLSRWRKSTIAAAIEQAEADAVAA